MLVAVKFDGLKHESLFVYQMIYAAHIMWSGTRLLDIVGRTTRNCSTFC